MGIHYIAKAVWTPFLHETRLYQNIKDSGMQRYSAVLFIDSDACEQGLAILKNIIPTVLVDAATIPGKIIAAFVLCLCTCYSWRFISNEDLLADVLKTGGPE